MADSGYQSTDRVDSDSSKSTDEADYVYSGACISADEAYVSAYESHGDGELTISADEIEVDLTNTEVIFFLSVCAVQT